MPPNNPDYSELLVQISYAFDYYKTGGLLGCLTDGLKFFYYKFSRIEEQGIKIEWRHRIFYTNSVPSEEEITSHLQFIADTVI